MLAMLVRPKDIVKLQAWYKRGKKVRLSVLLRAWWTLSQQQLPHSHGALVCVRLGVQVHHAVLSVATVNVCYK